MSIDHSDGRSAHFSKCIAMAVCALLRTTSAHADDPGKGILSFSGFGTLGVVHSSERNADFTSSVFKPNGAGHTHQWSPDFESLIGAQLNANFTPRLSAVLQVIAEQNSDNSYRPHVEWANIKYQLTPDIGIRAGRIVLATFLFSETRKVGYTSPWAHPPLEVNALNPITSNDGVDISYRMHLGEVTNTVQAAAGKNDRPLPNPSGTLESRGSLIISDTAEYGPLTVRASYYKTKTSLASLKTFFDSFRLFGPQGVAIADKYYTDGMPVSVAVMGAGYDPGRWFVMSEWGRLKSSYIAGKRNAWYASGGYRFGRFTPYVTYAEAKGQVSDPGLTVSTLPPPLAAPATILNAALATTLSRSPVQNTISIGGRWDFVKNASLKAQFDHTTIGTGSTGLLINPQPGFQLGGKVNVFSLAVDFVF